MIRYFFFLFALGFQSCFSQQSFLVDKNIEKQIDLLINKMSLNEKVGQTCQITLDALLKRDENNKVIEPVSIDSDKLKEAITEYSVGSILNVGSHTLDINRWKHIMENIHKPFLDKKVKVPLIYGIDAIHGVNYTVGGTLFPQEIGLAATWNTQLAEAFGHVVAYETKASGIPWNFSPVLDLGRQPLWSRHFETLGEDPFLASEMGTAIIKGYQGKGKPDAYHTAACLKHFVGYSNPLSGRDRTPAWIPDKYMKELYLPPFKKAVESGALTLMINSGVVNGIPGHMNHHLLTKILKEDWGFKGFTVSDWEDFIMLHTVHNTAYDLSDAVVKAFNAGVDMSMVPYSPQYMEYCKIMIKAVEDGKISEERLDDAVRRILRVKFLVGLFDKNMNQATSYPDFGSEKYKNLAMKTALESITLLKNQEGVLPLTTSKKVLVAGPTSNNLIFLNGAWTHTWQGVDAKYNTKECLSVKEAFEEKIGTNCLFAQGAELFLEDNYENSKLIDEQDFLLKCKQAEVIVLCLGEFPSTEKPGDIRSLNLDPAQLRLAEMAYASQKPVILVLVEGRPRIIRTIEEKASAIVQAYLPGDYGAEALVKLLYGEDNFSGKLPYSYPRFDGQIEFYDRPRSVDRSKSNDFKAYNPQWNFGFGISYSKLVYSNLKLEKTAINLGESLKLSVDIKNESERKVSEVVQLYLSDMYASMVPSGKSLKAFQKIDLNSGASVRVEFILTPEMLKFVDVNGNWITEKGMFKLSVDDLIAKFELK